MGVSLSPSYDYLSSHRIAEGSEPAAHLLVEAEPDLETYRVTSGGKFATRVWDEVTRRHRVSGHVAGDLLEQLLAVTFLKCSKGPFMAGIDTDLVPTHRIDFWFETVEGQIIAISSNAQLKERWKNENLAAHVLKFKHPSSRWFVITAYRPDQDSAQRRLRNGTPNFLDGVFDLHSSEFDDLCKMLSRLRFRAPTSAFTRGRLIQ